MGFDRDSLNYAAILGTDFGGVLLGLGSQHSG